MRRNKIKAKRTAVHLIKLGKMTLEEIAEATELSLDIVKELESQSMQLAKSAKQFNIKIIA